MLRLPFCALAIFVITGMAATAQSAHAAPNSGAEKTDLKTQSIIIGHKRAGDVVALGEAKSLPPCPPFCILRRDASPRAATVGEREVVAFHFEAATSGPRLHVDTSRSAWIQEGKLPRAAITPQAPETLTTRNLFRPALDPVLSEPTTTTAE